MSATRTTWRIHSLPGCDRKYCAPNTVELSSYYRAAASVRRAYRSAREAGLDVYRARRLVWETVFAAHLADGGTWVARDDAEGM